MALPRNADVWFLDVSIRPILSLYNNQLVSHVVSRNSTVYHAVRGDKRGVIGS